MESRRSAAASQSPNYLGVKLKVNHRKEAPYANAYLYILGVIRDLLEGAESGVKVKALKSIVQ